MFTSTTQPRNAGPEPSSAPASPRGTSSSAPRPFGLRVRVSLDTTQRFLFGERGAFPEETRSLPSGHDGPSMPTRLAEELCVLVARIVVSDFRIHSQLDRTVPAVLRNVRLGFWSCARRAALDAAAALARGAKLRVLQPCMAIEAANLALRLAGRCENAERSVRIERQQVEDYRRAVRSEFAAMHRDRREQEARRRAEARESLPLGHEESF